MSRRLVCWRHGQTVWNAESRFQGQTDIPLNETGLAQAERAARLLAALRPAAIISSDLMRAADTAAALAAVTGLPVKTDKRLRERSGGSWEGCTAEEIKRRWPAEDAAWEPPEGELVPAVAERVAEGLQSAIDTAGPDDLVVVVSHGAAIRLGMAKLLGLPEEHWPLLGPLNNCSWSVLSEGRRGWRLLEHNAGTLPEPVLSDDR
ncbi:MAG: histidine phosphatase family protein [Streptosporangiales bacterium]|nr:histidine phosphatase family protein [Streptosporangiales bacterium]